MKAASLNEIKKELTFLEPEILQQLCLRLAKYKVENKELLTYLLFEANNEPDYIENVKSHVDKLFEDFPSKTNLYLAKKSLRKILRFTNKQIRYSGNIKTEVELRIFFCTKLKDSKIKIRESVVLTNLYKQQMTKIETALSKLPEDLQYDYQKEIKYLS